jgi:hypothetical protein
MSAIISWEPQLRALMATRGLAPTEALARVDGGRNNRVYKLQAGGQCFAVKRYHRDPADPRDRFRAETDFLSVVASPTAHDTPQLIATDREHGLAVLEWIDGAAIVEPREPFVRAALRFIERINSPPLRCLARRRIGPASQAAESLRAHAAGLNDRVAALRRRCQCPPESAESAAAILARLESAATAQFAAPLTAAPLTAAQRILSPSDFGFHNALVRSGGVAFIDFEYAGWDDPAKLICDFFLQPQVPVPSSLLPAFTAGIASACRLDGEWLARRVDRLMPICRLLWACIALNVLDPVHLQRRLAATGPGNVAQRVSDQLRLAERYLDANEL